MEEVRVIKMGDLSEEIFDLKVINKIKELEKKDYKTVSFAEIANDKVLKAIEEIENWNIADEDLFE